MGFCRSAVKRCKQKKVWNSWSMQRFAVGWIGLLPVHLSSSSPQKPIGRESVQEPGDATSVALQHVD